MPFDDELKNKIDEYCKKDLPKDANKKVNFDFISDIALRDRIQRVFDNTRYIYKVFEGLGASEDLLIAEIKLQVMMYASIYEAVLNYVLFHIPLYASQHTLNERYSKFYEKCMTAFNLGLLQDNTQQTEFPLISPSQITDGTCVFCNELIIIYRQRSTIHICKESNENINFALDTSRIAYRRIELFINQIRSKLKNDGIIN